MDVDAFKPPRSWKLAPSEPPLAFKSDLLLRSGDGPNVSASFMVRGGYQPNWTLFILQLPLIKHKLMRPTPRFSGPAPARVAAVVAPAFLTAEYITWCISSQTSRSCMSTNDLGNSIVFPAFFLEEGNGKDISIMNFTLAYTRRCRFPARPGWCVLRNTCKDRRTDGKQEETPHQSLFSEKAFFYLNWFTLLVAPGEVHV